jgi:hypothetical protein
MSKLNSGWLWRSMKAIKQETKVLGGSWEPADMIGHAHRQEARIRRLRVENKRLRAALKEVMNKEGKL